MKYTAGFYVKKIGKFGQGTGYVFLTAGAAISIVAVATVICGFITVGLTPLVFLTAERIASLGDVTVVAAKRAVHKYVRAFSINSDERKIYTKHEMPRNTIKMEEIRMEEIRMEEIRMEEISESTRLIQKSLTTATAPHHKSSKETPKTSTKEFVSVTNISKEERPDIQVSPAEEQSSLGLRRGQK